MSAQAALFDLPVVGRRTVPGGVYVDSMKNIKYVDTSSPPPHFHRSVLSLFSGAGGLDIGLEQAGFETVACVEMDRDCRATLSHNRPQWHLVGGRFVAGDIRGVRGGDVLHEIGMKRGELGVIAGGPPCQPFSNLGKRQGKGDPRNGDLFEHYLRLVDECLPHGIIFENVEGFAQEKHSELRVLLLNHLERLGYDLESGVLTAADYGDPQVRRRFVTIGVRGAGLSAAMPLPTHFESPVRAEALWKRLGVRQLEYKSWRTVGEAFAELDLARLGRDDNLTMGVSPVVLERMKLIRQGENFKVLPIDMLPKCWSSGRHQGQDTFGRLRSDRPSVTIRTSGYNSAKGRYIHPSENRGLSTAEMAQLQSFPSEWKFRCAGQRQSLVGIGRMIGNAVPVQLASAMGLALRTQFGWD